MTSTAGTSWSRTVILFAMSDAEADPSSGRDLGFIFKRSIIPVCSLPSRTWSSAVAAQRDASHVARERALDMLGRVGARGRHDLAAVPERRHLPGLHAPYPYA